MPYLLVIDSEGIVRYRFDKLRSGPAATATFRLYRTDASGAYHGRALTRMYDLKGIANVQARAKDLPLVPSDA